MATITLSFDGQNALGECALWCDRTRCVLWTDIPAAILWSHTPATGATRSWPMPERLACLALTRHASWLLLGLASRLAWFDLNTGKIIPIRSVEESMPSTRLNDGRCDRQGRFIFGTLNEHEDRAPIGSFYRLNHDLTLERLPLPQAAIPNSICFSPDGCSMYYCDSLTKTIRCCDYRDGLIANDRLFADLTLTDGVPDGSAIDSEGFLWNAHWGAARIVRYHPSGAVDRVIAVPADQPSCVAFGGPRFDHLYATTARIDLTAAALAETPHAGGLFSIRLDGVAGLPESRFAGIPSY